MGKKTNHKAEADGDGEIRDEDADLSESALAAVNILRKFPDLVAADKLAKAAALVKEAAAIATEGKIVGGQRPWDDIFLCRSRLALLTGKYDKALADAKRAQKMGRAESAELAARACVALGDSEQAHGLIEDAIAAFPDDTRVQASLAAVRSLLDTHEEVLRPHWGGNGLPIGTLRDAHESLPARSGHSAVAVSTMDAQGRVESGQENISGASQVVVYGGMLLGGKAQQLPVGDVYVLSSTEVSIEGKMEERYIWREQKTKAKVLKIQVPKADRDGDDGADGDKLEGSRGLKSEMSKDSLHSDEGGGGNKGLVKKKTSQSSKTDKEDGHRPSDLSEEELEAAEAEPEYRFEHPDPPPPRTGHAAVCLPAFDDLRGGVVSAKIMVFGGETVQRDFSSTGKFTRSKLNDAWLLDTATWEWELNTPCAVPVRLPEAKPDGEGESEVLEAKVKAVGRKNSTMTPNSKGGKGGGGQAAAPDDEGGDDDSGGAGRGVFLAAKAPPALSHMSATVMGDMVYYFGGFNAAGALTNGMYRFKVSHRSWAPWEWNEAAAEAAKVEKTSSMNTAREQEEAAVVDQKGGGKGGGGKGKVSDAGSDSKNKKKGDDDGPEPGPEVSGTPPCPRAYHAAAQVSACHLLVHGGSNGKAKLNDFFFFNVTTCCWSECLPSSLSGEATVPRCFHSMTLVGCNTDFAGPVAQQLLIMGGVGEGGGALDTVQILAVRVRGEATAANAGGQHGGDHGGAEEGEDAPAEKRSKAKSDGGGEAGDTEGEHAATGECELFAFTPVCTGTPTSALCAHQAVGMCKGQVFIIGGKVSDARQTDITVIETRPEPVDPSTFGHCQYPNGDEYRGEWAGSQRHGEGVCSYATGDIYTGPWVDDVRCGEVGECVYGNGDKYAGQWEAGDRNGEGVLTYAFGGEYDGSWVNGCRCGDGQEVKFNGDVYVGQWEADVRSGEGSVRFAGQLAGQPGNEFQGSFRQDKMHGEGKMTYRQPKGGVSTVTETYSGHFAGDVRDGDGKGTVYGRDSFEYDGQWRSDYRNGFGRSKHRNGDVYEGKWLSNKRSGRGSCTYANGDVYDGLWRSGLRHGEGVLLTKDGERYEGMWKLGNKCGGGMLEEGVDVIDAMANMPTASRPSSRASELHGHSNMPIYSRPSSSIGFARPPSGYTRPPSRASRPNSSAGGITRKTGVFDKNAQTAHGTAKYANGDEYDGQWRHGLRHGRGVCTSGDRRSIYSGAWEMDRRQGKGTLIIGRDSKYVGEWWGDERHGHGVLETRGGKYDGQFCRSAKSGSGREAYSSGDVYEGQWLASEPCGRGTMTYATGNVYEGDWRGGERVGEGVMVASDTERYEGRWAGDHRNIAFDRTSAPPSRAQTPAGQIGSGGGGGLLPGIGGAFDFDNTDINLPEAGVMRTARGAADGPLFTQPATPVFSLPVAERSLLSEINAARCNPSAYAAVLAGLLPKFDGNTLVLQKGAGTGASFVGSGRQLVHTKEGRVAVEEAIRYLRAVHKVPALRASRGLSNCAVSKAHQLAEVADDSSVHHEVYSVGASPDPPAQLRERAEVDGVLPEGDMAYLREAAALVACPLMTPVMQWLIDDGDAARPNRETLFCSELTFAGIGLVERVATGKSMKGRRQQLFDVTFASSYEEIRIPDEELLDDSS